MSGAVEDKARSDAIVADVAPKGEGALVKRNDAARLAPARVQAHVVAAPRRRRRLPLRAIFFLVFTLVPTIVVGGYLALFAAHRYTTEFRVAVRNVEPLKSVAFPALLGIGGASQGASDSQAVVQFVQSRESVDELDKALGIRAKYSDPAIDWWSRLSASETIEGVVRYWRNFVDAYYDNVTGAIVVRVTAFSPDDSFAISKSVRDLSEALVNRMSAHARDDAVSFAKKEVADAQDTLGAIDAKLRALRDTEHIVDPRKTAEASLLLASKLQEEIANLNVQIDDQRKSLGENAPTLVANLDRQASLKRELASVQSTMTAGSDSAKPLSSVIGAFDQLQSESEFAQKNYAVALAALETARLDASRQQIYLATIIPPAKPEEASFPQPLRSAAFTFAAAAALWVILQLVYQAIREHA